MLQQVIKNYICCCLKSSMNLKSKYKLINELSKMLII